MAQEFVSDLLYEFFFFSSFFFSLVATELLCIEYPFFSALFFQREDDEHVPFIYSEFPQRSLLPKFIQPSFIISRLKNNNSSSSSSSSCFSSVPNPETKDGKSTIKREEPMEVICEICAEAKQITQMIKNQTCHHSYCSDCMTKHVAKRIQDSITGVPCPGLGCKTIFELEVCRPWLPMDLVERWDQALCEALFLQVPNFSWFNPETKHVKSSIKTEEPFEVICEICAETKRITQMFKNQTCDHSYCSDCMTKHVATKIQDSITEVPCPGLHCKTVFEMEACRPWLPNDLIERWDQARCEALFLQVPKFYCPFKDCSAMMLVENEEDQLAAWETECPVCHRMFCPRCNVPWHSGFVCEEYQKLNEIERQREDLLLRQLAKEKKWRKCPKCKFFVEKTYGCMHITCRCKYEFCYACGKKWTSTHGAHCPRY